MLNRGIDRAFAPYGDEPERWKTKERAEWINVYLAGPGATPEQPSWSKEKVHQLAYLFDFGLLFCYPGWQWNHPDRLTAERGSYDGHHAATLVTAFGVVPSDSWEPAATNPRPPIALDVEYETSTRYPNESVAYAIGWCSAVWDDGFYPEIYGVPSFLAFFAAYHDQPCPTRCWIASWADDEYADWDVVDGRDNLFDIPGMSNSYWSEPAQRRWQFVNQKQRGIDLNISNIPVYYLPNPEDVPPPPPENTYAPPPLENTYPTPPPDEETTAIFDVPPTPAGIPIYPRRLSEIRQRMEELAAELRQLASEMPK